MNLPYSLNDMALLPLSAYDRIGEKLSGTRIVYAPGQSGLSGEMIGRGTELLFQHWDVNVANDWNSGDFPEVEIDDVDYFVYGGGGTLGSLYQEALVQRQWLVGRYANLPIIVLPQSYTAGDENKPSGITIFSRELTTIDYLPGAILAPDLAMVLTPKSHSTPIQYEHGLFLREDQERKMVKHYKRHLGDPANYCKNWEEYLKLAASYESITTDRVHFALCALMIGRKVTLLPSRYHKNLSMYETWLKELGCLWLDIKF